MFLPGLHTMAGLIYGYKEIDPVDVVDDIECPVLFIHEEEDAFVTEEETRELYRTSDNPRDEIWEITDAEHSEGFLIDPEEYIGKVIGFLERVME
jgi:fermentation-respiration switch protein FrsA (DUF1100 family)